MKQALAKSIKKYKEGVRCFLAEMETWPVRLGVDCG